MLMMTRRRGARSVAWLSPRTLSDPTYPSPDCVPTLTLKAGHHNIGALCWGTTAANRVFDAEFLNHDHTVGINVRTAARAIYEIIQSQNMDVHAGTFGALRHGKLPDSGDEERDY